MAINSVKQDEQIKESVNYKLIFRLMKYLKPYWKKVIVVMALMGVVIGVELLNPFFMKLAIDSFIETKDSKGILILGIGMVIINFIAMLCAANRIRIMVKISNEILLKIRQEIFIHIQKLSFSFFDSRPLGKILARIIGDVSSLNNLFSNSITNLIPDTIKICAVTVIMINLNYKLAVISLIMLPFLIVAMFFIQIVSKKRWKVYRNKNSNMNAFTHEGFSGIKVIQSFSAERRRENEFSTLASDLRKAFVKAIQMNDFFGPLVDISWGIGGFLVYWYGVRLIDSKSITVGLLVAFTGYIGLFWKPIMNLSNFYNQLITNLSGAERIFEILDINPDITDLKTANELPPIKGEVVFSKVTFGYDEKRSILKDVSFTVKPGKTVALVGPTGAGKTTIINLISRFYESNRGEVLIDGFNVQDVTLDSLRSQLGIMTQDTFLFSGSIKDNIKYGNLEATDEQVIEAAKKVNAHEFIMKFEKGYDTNVNERGARLSNGQRQLIAFARTMLKAPKILILDEATASIDTHTERLIQKGIEELLYGRTSFVIAHRLSTIVNADVIFVIDNGKIVEKGTHKELVNKKGHYSGLYNAQFKFLKDEKAG